MGKKMKLLPSIFKNRELLWPSCAQPKTLSFRAPATVFNTINSAFLASSDGVESPESWFTTTSESTGFLTDHSEDSHLETIINGIRSSERLFFEPGKHTDSSIMGEKIKMIKEEDAAECQDHNCSDNQTPESESPFKESVILAMETEDPYRDFKKSMQEMVESYHGSKDWEWFQELLGWYLKMNGNGNHGYIVGAFTDLLIELSADSITTSSHSHSKKNCSYDSLSTSYSSANSCLSSSPASPLYSLSHNEIEEEQG